MMMRMCLRSLFATLVLGAVTTVSAADFYVSPQGNDAWTGKLPAPNATKTDGPLATLVKARDVVRAELKGGGAGQAQTVHVRGGLYEFKDTLKLSKEDFGTTNAPVIYRAYQQEQPIFVGGSAITNFTVHKGAILKADVGAQGFKNVYFRQLIFDGKRQHLARYPNYDASNPYGGGWAYADGKYIPMYQDVPNESKRTFQFKTTDARTWAKPEEGEVFVFPRYNWWNNIVRIASIDRAARQVTLTADASYAIRPSDRYYFQNLFEELDAPGEWYLDRQTWTLYFWPPSSLEGKTVVAPRLRTILDIADGASNVMFEGITFECAEGTAISLRNTTNCVIAKSIVRNVGDYNGSGIGVSGGYRNGVVGCDISEIGSTGVFLSGGDRKKLTSAENYAENNYIHHVGVFYKQGVGIGLYGVGNRASHNLIHDGPRMGIMFSGNNLVLEYNEIRHVNLETEDTGAVYTGGRDWISSRGTVIRYNYFHDILGYGQENGVWKSPHFAWGVYLDDNTGGVDVIGNIVARCSRAGLHLHNGRDNRIENNVFIDNGLYQAEYSGWVSTSRFWKDHLPTMITGYESVMNEPAWKNMRNMNLHPTNAVLADGKIQTGNLFARNIVSYTNAAAKLYRMGSVPYSHNAYDYNVFWHHGLPLLTGERGNGKEIGGNLVVNGDFEEGADGQSPRNWKWQVQPPRAKATWTTAEHANGKAALRIDSAPPVKDSSGRGLFLNYVSADMATVHPGKSYHLKAKFKADKPDTKVSLMLQSYVDKIYFWASSPNDVKVGTEWQEASFSFRTPASGERGYNAAMKAFKIRIDVRQDSGTVFVDDVSLVEVETMDEWQSWLALGMDKNSKVADPLFVDATKDDYRLKPESPAFKLGFKPIPVEKIGPYQSPQRVTWPIKEAEGAREKPLVSN
ncbi:MAG TPA: right-handed parallel beta-helix repeat-containing protein [Verrucomicrobiae bacterium]